MFSKHPKGLIAAALANLGERFGFYTMMAILVLFLQAKFGLDGKSAGFIYSTFYFSIYILALVGGIIADKTRNYKGTIMVGIILMALGYLMLAIPSKTPVDNQTLFLTITCIGLFVIAFGNGLFKGNLQALVGQMYDNPQYSSMRDSGFSLFYMFINIGAIFAPMAAIGVRNWWLSTFGYAYNADLPALCHGQLAGTLTPEAMETYTKMASESSATSVTDLTAFAADYLNVFTTGFHYAFGVAIVAMAVSLLIYIVNKKNFPDPSKKAEAGKSSGASAAVAEMSPQEVKQRIYALFAVFGIVIFFWFSFHQNGLTLTFFAKEYTDLNLFGMPISAELFQSLNPFFVVFLTPVVMAIFARQRARGCEPSTPKKIAIGMGIAASAFVVMALGSYFSHLPLHSEILAVGTSPVKVTPLLLMVTYLILTVAELYISPLGISFVSKVAPPKYQGIMQGGWLGATAIGNQLLFIGAVLYESIPIWMTWTVFVVACSLSMITMLCMLKWLERVAK
ncbi:peptide MFS transporter [Bacteroides sp.]